MDAVLNVGNLSARFTQDVEDMNQESDDSVGKSVEELKTDNKTKTDRQATQKQITFLGEK